MRKLKSSIFLLFVMTSISSCKNELRETEENCQCINDLDFVIEYYERNLPGFKDNVTPNTETTYNDLKERLKTEAEKVKNPSECFKITTYYVEFFRDNHSSIYMSPPRVDESNQDQLNTFINSDIYKSRETYNLSNDDIKQYPLEDIRGLYQTSDGTYTVAIIPNEGALRKYIGVITESKTKLWKKGQIKLELNPKSDGSYEAFVYMRNHGLQYNPNFKLVNGVLGDGWFKTLKPNFENPVVNNDWSFYIDVLNDDTAYLRIPTFSHDYSAKLDSLYKAAKPIIEKHPYLIIDVRNNGGGSDSNVNPLLDYIYTQPLKNDNVDIWVTRDNIAQWERWYEEDKKDTINYTKEDIQWYEEQIALMKSVPLNTFVNRSKGEDEVRKINPNKPKKVAILQNKYCASSCETLLFWGKQSTNTILVGENSGGYVGYGEVGNIKTPCYKYDLYTTMTRYQEERKYEVIGISPDYYLSYDKDWIEQTIDLLHIK